MKTRVFVAKTLAAVIFAAPLAGYAQQPMELTALDYIQIQQLVARYARAIDTCSNNGYDYADLFTSDGAFIPIINGEAIPVAQGREALAEISGGGSNQCRNVGWIEQGVRHVYTNHVIEPTPEGARGTVDMLLIGLGGDPNKIEHDGYYEDIYVRTDDGWRFRQRTHHATFDAATRPEAAPDTTVIPDTSGPYAAVMEMDPRLPDHTVYRPAELSSVDGRLPIFSFGNGGCINVGSRYQTFLGEIASHGYVVVASGPIDPAAAGAEQSTTASLVQAIEWALAENERAGSPYRARIDTDSIAVGGHSCGGLQAIAVGADPRVDTVLVLNSGIIRGGIPTPEGGTREPAGYIPATEADLANLHTPVFYVTGGETDQAQRGAEADFQQIDAVPVFYATLPVGHSGTWREPRGGRMGAAALSWLDWQLKGDAAAGQSFNGAACGLCSEIDWTVKRKNWQ